MRVSYQARLIGPWLLALGGLCPTWAEAETYAYAGYAVYPGGVVPEDLVVADLNADGFDDLAIANTNVIRAAGVEYDTVSVYLSTGAGAFVAPVEYPVGDRPEGIAVADLDQNGTLDIATADFQGDTVSLLFGDEGAAPGSGDGTFTPGTPLRVPGGPRSVLAQDLDGDGHADLVTSNYRAGTLTILKGNGDGSFELLENIGAGRAPEVVASGLFNDDTIPDLVACDASGAVVIVFVGDGALGFTRVQTVVVGDTPRHVRCADLDSDGMDEIVVANYRSHNVRILKNVGEVTFQMVASVETPAMTGPIYTSVADLNDDSRLDILVSFAFSRSLVVYPARPELTFGEGQVIPTGENPVGVAVGDFDRDSFPDLVVANALDDDVFVFQGSAIPGIVTIDDGASGTSASGEWTASAGIYPFGTGSMHSMQVSGASFQWSAALDPGRYAVYAWWSSSGGRATEAPYTIRHSGTPSTTTVTVNQHRDAGRWNLLGRFPFETTGVVSVESTSSELSTCADAVTFVPLLTGAAPPRQLPSDCTQDGHLDVTDAICLLRGLFLGMTEAFPCGSLATSVGTLVLLDANGDAALNVADPVYVLTHLFAGGPPPILGQGCVVLPGCPQVCSSDE